MKTLVLLFLSLMSCVNAFAQDSEGYFDITQQNGALRHIQSPNKDIQNTKWGNMEKKPYVQYYNALSKEPKKNLQYKLGFLIMWQFDFQIPKGSRLLIKYKDGTTITLKTNTDNTSTLDYFNGSSKYYTSVSYVITNQQLDKIIKVGVTKIRIETLVKNFDIEPESSISELTKSFKAGLYNRYNKTKDSFTADF